MELRLDGWRSGLRFAAAHIVPGHPKCGRLHGHTYAVHCQIEGNVPEDGMIVDFGIIKGLLRDLADELDHRFIVPGEHPEVTLTETGDETEMRWGEERIVAPTRAVKVLPVPNGTVEHMAAWMAEQLLKKGVLPPNVTRFGVGIDEGYGKGAWAYHEL